MTYTLPLPVPDDERDMVNGSFKVYVLPSFDYLIGGTANGDGVTLFRSVDVTDNDTPQELELNFGKDSVNDADTDEGDTIGFVVKRRQQDADTSQTATFTVRLETDRSGDDNLLADWTEDTATGRLYKDYRLQLTGADLEIGEAFVIPDNGESETDWSYWASIRDLEDYNGAALDSAEEATYWTVKAGFRETIIDATDSGAKDGKVKLFADASTVVEGSELLYTLKREGGPMSQSLRVRVQTWEPSRIAGFGINPSLQYHWITFQPWESEMQFDVFPYVDNEVEAADQLHAEVQQTGSRYSEGSPYTAIVDIEDPPSGSAFVSLSGTPTSMSEGESATFTFTRTGGETTQPLTVDFRVDDPMGFLRGNHWDEELDIPTQVVVAANSTSETITLTAPDDQRDLPDDNIKIWVLPGSDYLLGNTGLVTSATVSVTDNDVVQELTFDWGYLDFDDVWEAGESWTYEQNSLFVLGPGEGLFYYDDDRAFRFHHDADEYFPIHFMVKRRAADVGMTATFVVRVEHNRGWNQPRHTDWSTDPETGRRYKDYYLTLEGDQIQVIGRIEILDNGLPDPPGWSYRASIKPLEDVKGVVLSNDQESEYWTVNGTRSGDIEPFDRLYPEVYVKRVGPQDVNEGQVVEFEVERQRGNSLAPLPVRVRTWELNQRADDGSNPTDQIHTVILPAVAMTSHWTNYYGNVGASQSVKFSVTVTSDTNYESLDYLNAVVLPIEEGLHDSRSRSRYRIHDLDLPTIALSVDPTSITEGEALTFTLTRGNNTSEDLIVAVSVNDPGGFLEGNFGTDSVATPAFVVFAPDDLTATVTLTPPDDWRDIPDSILTFTVVEDSAYEITGSASLTVQVADNDVAPQVGISFNQAEVEEGNDLILTITRTGEDKNPLQVPITAGPVGDEEDFVVELDAGESQAQVTFSRFDDNSKGPDTDYAATLQPGSPEFWTSTGPGTVTATILDDDLYKVGIEMLTPVVSEGQYIRYRIFHDGHSGESLDFKVRRSEDGSAVLDTVLGDFTWQFSAGKSEQRISTLSEAHDGSDGDAVFTIEILPGDGYTVDPAYASGQAIVRDGDPLPVLGLRNLTVRGNEGDGTFEFRVDMVSPLPSLRTVTVDYEVCDSVTSDGIDITESTGTLTFAAGETSAVIEVPILQDLIAEEDEEFVVVLTNPVYATFQDGQSSLTARGVIEDDEPTVIVAATEIAISEGEDVEVTLTRTGAATGELTAWLMVRLTGGPGGTTFPQVTFSAGSSTVTHTINTEDDDEALGSFEVKISVAHPADDVGQANTYRTTGAEETVIVGDDEQPGVWLETMNDDGSAGNGNPYPLIPIPRRIYEGQAIFFKLIRLRSGPGLTINLQGTGAENFVSGTLPTTATIHKGSKTATIRIQTANDLVAESHAEFTLTILEGAGYAPGDRVGRRFSAGHWIYDNDTYGLPKLRITENSPWVNEGEDVVFTLQRIGDTQASLDVNVRVFKNGGDADTNFIQEVGNEVVTFAAGADTTTLTIATVDDNLNHGDRNIVAAIAPGAYFIDESVPNVDEEMVWIQDDDRPTVTLTPATDEFEEGTPQMVTLNRVGDNSPYLSIPTMIETTVHHPNSADERTTLYEFPFTRINKGLASFASRIGTTQQVEALGASGRVWFLPRTCIDSPEYPSLGGCGDSPQYLRGSQYEQTFIIYSKFMGVRIEADQTTVGEGTAATFTLHRHGGRSSNLAKTLQVNVRVTQDGDYISGSAPQKVTFEADQTTATLSLPTADDVVDEADGLIAVELLPPTSYTDDQYAYEIGEYRGTPWAVTSVTTAVTDDDYAFPAISILDADALESEGSIEFTVMLDRANDEQEISVDWATAVDGSSDAATGDADFTAASGTLIFAIGETTKTITITLLDDTLGEATETFNVVLGNPTDVVLEDDTGSGTIRDDESDVAVVFAASTLHVEEGNNVVVTFRRLVSADLAGTANCYAGLPDRCFDADADPGNVPLTINLSVTQVGDFLSGSAPTFITFAAGEKFADLSIPTADDNNVEASGTITVQILQGSGYTALATGTIQGQPATNPARVHNVYDDDLTFTIDDAQADESDGQIDFTVRLNAAALEEVTIDVFTQDGDATSHANVTASSFGKDFEAKSETLVFVVGEQQKTFTVDIADDFIYERNETFTVQISNPPRYLSLADGTEVGTITDDEDPMVASVSRAYSVVDEGQTGPVRYNVQLTHPDTVASKRTPAVVWQIVEGTATEGEDYQVGGGKLSFPMGTTSGIFEVYLVDDKLLEQPLESFTVELIPGSISDDTRFLSISSTDGTFETSIRDNESLTATISSNAESVAEGQQVAFTVTLIGALGAESVSVTFETAGSAVETDDFGTPTGLLSFPPGNTTGNAGTLEIPAGQSSGTITYPILSDSIEEGDEALTIEIFSAHFGARSDSISETQSVATTTILDQDSLTVSIQGTPSVDEGTAAAFTIVMSTVSDESVTADWETRQVGEDLETGETAVPDADYTAASGSVTIPSGNTSATFTVSTLQDTLAEGDETFKVALTEARVTSSSPVEEFSLGVAMATGTIVDDDTAPDGLSMQVTPDSVDEDSGATDLTVTVTLDGTVQFPTDTPVTVEFIDRPNVIRNATLGEDYTAATVTVDIPAGQSSVVATITLTPDDDNIWEGNEIARLAATSSVLSNSDALSVTIVENDVEPNEVVLTVAPATVDESTPTTSLVVTGTLTGGSALPVDTVVTLEAIDDTAVSGDDYEVNMATLTIPAGELGATTTLSLTVLDDNIHEGDEQLKVGGTTPGTIQVVPAVVTIQDNDNEPTSIGLSVTAAPIDEGSSVVTIAVEATILGGGTRNEATQIAMRFV